MSSLFRRSAALVAVTAGLTLGAAATAPAAPAAAEDTASQATPVMVILDASGSMNTADAPGPRIDAAKHAVDGLVDALPTSAQVGLEVYGTSTSSAPSAKAAGCKDITVLQSVGPLERDAVHSDVSAIRASGYTPIGQSLLTAAHNLPQEGPRSIVLVSDGIDTCAPPDPCDVAKQLKAQGVDITIHTIGFRVDAQARTQLACIADATGGTYRDAGSGAALGEQLQSGVQRAMQPYQVVGTPIQGSASAEGAPQVRPGQYQDVYARGGDGLGLSGTAKYYTIELHKGQTPYFAATIVPPDVPTDAAAVGVDVELSDLQDDADCMFDMGTGYDVNAIAGKVNVSTGVLAPGEVGGPKWPSGCPTDGTFAVKVSRTNTAFEDQPLKMELDFHLEPPADASGLPRPATPTGNLRTDMTSTPHAVHAGDSFNDAPELRPGTYGDTFVTGETRFYKVHLDWGQRLAWTVTPQKLPNLGLTDGVTAYTYLANPVRENVDTADTGGGTSAFAGSSDQSLSDSSLVPARYTNRSSGNDSVRAYALDGDYYLSLSTGYPRGSDASFTVPYTFTLQVFGTPERGPVYQQLPGNPTSSQSSSGSSAPQSAQPGSSAPSGSSTTAPSSAVSDDSSIPTPAIVGGGAGLLACASAAGFVVLRRRRTPPGAAETAPLPTWPQQGPPS